MLLLAESGSFSRLFGFDGTPDYKQTVNYKVTRKQVTENFVDANGAKITAPTGFTQGNKIPMTSNTFKYTAAKAFASNLYRRWQDLYFPRLVQRQNEA